MIVISQRVIFVFVFDFFFFKQKTAYEMRISDWSSDVCSSDLLEQAGVDVVAAEGGRQAAVAVARGAAFYRRPDRVGAILPEGLPILQPQRARRIRQPVAGGPAHRNRIGVDVRFGSQLPKPGVGLVVDRPGMLTDTLQREI